MHLMVERHRYLGVMTAVFPKTDSRLPYWYQCCFSSLSITFFCLHIYYPCCESFSIFNQLYLRSIDHVVKFVFTGAARCFEIQERRRVSPVPTHPEQCRRCRSRVESFRRPERWSPPFHLPGRLTRNVRRPRW